ncbi:MAG: 3-keto-disaccharide hydrolase [Terriglobia bacterium]
MRFRLVLWLFIAILPLVSFGSPHSEGQAWKKIFNGKTLDGWKAPDMSYFSVEDGAITGQTTREHNPPENQFIVWQDGRVNDFKLKFKFRLFGPKANSGMQFRSQVKERGLVHGYQADMATSGPYLGAIWDEYGERRSLAARGEKSVINEAGQKTATRFAAAEALLKGINLEDWNEYHITARGPHIVLRIKGNGRTGGSRNRQGGLVRCAGDAHYSG